MVNHRTNNCSKYWKILISVRNFICHPNSKCRMQVILMWIVNNFKVIFTERNMEKQCSLSKECITNVFSLIFLYHNIWTDVRSHGNEWMRVCYSCIFNAARKFAEIKIDMNAFNSIQMNFDNSLIQQFQFRMKWPELINNWKYFTVAIAVILCNLRRKNLFVSCLIWFPGLFFYRIEV